MSGRQDAAFQDIFGSDRRMPARHHPEQYSTRPVQNIASSDDPYRTRSFQGSSVPQVTLQNGFRSVPPGHPSQNQALPQQFIGGRIIATQQRPEHRNASDMQGALPVTGSDYDRAQSLSSSSSRSQFARAPQPGRLQSMTSTTMNYSGSAPYPSERGPGTQSRRVTEPYSASQSLVILSSTNAPNSSSPGVDMMRGKPDHPALSVSRTIHEDSALPTTAGSYFAATPSRTFSSSTEATKIADRSQSMTSTSSKMMSDRTFSFNGSSTTLTDKRPSYGSIKSQQGLASSGQAVYTTSKRAPMVYPALLSRVADAFQQRIALSERIKDGLSYKDAFLGCDAVDVIAYIIKTTDRNLALLLGRALDAQKFLHDVTYYHRLRDSSNEVYQFRENLAVGFREDSANSNGLSNSASMKERKRPSRAPTVDSVDSTFLEAQKDTALLELEDGLPNGVFTLLTECYSPTCTRDRLCYSIACPRRLEQQARLNMRPTPGLRRAESRGSLNELVNETQENKLWINTVSQDIVDSVDDAEKKRQEIICEAIYTERDFVKDLEYLRDFWMKPLRMSNCIPEARREKFIRVVFSNVLEVHNVNSRLAEALTHRQQAQAVVHEIGDIFLEFIPHFDPFIRYGSLQLHAKYEFEREKSMNPQFAKFVEETERLKESRKLELNGYLTKPTTRLARYPLLLEAIAKTTKDNNADKVNLPKAVTAIKVFLSRVNAESGKAENRFNLMQLQSQLVNKPGEPDPNLKLTDENRLLIFKGALKKKNVGNANAGANTSSDVQVFLFDHVLLMVKAKTINKRETLKVHRKVNDATR